MKSITLMVLTALVFGATGCATGPLRYKTLGRYKYATVEFTKRTPPLAKPFAAAGGVLADGTILVVDTLIVPLVSLPIAVTLGVMVPFSEPGGFERHPIQNTTLGVLLFPIYLPWAYSLNLYFQSYAPKETPYFESFYPDFYGDESSFFADVPIRRKVPTFPPPQ